MAAGFRPAAAVLALATAFAPGAVSAQPVPLQVIHGGATFTSNGANLLVTTTNGAGTNHSAIDWRSFSVPRGSVTQFLQPSATSTSINRVVEANPSSILGNLGSNGRLVLVNPSGITVGGGAVIDTAGFTASALGMSEADARAGLLRFGGPGALLKVEPDAVIRARGGDVVLIAPQLETGAKALVESDGATLLLAGRKVEITGRGLEGIHMEVQAGTEAVNLGTLKGDAVGIFAGTLRHSGLVQAEAVSVEGGKVVLQAKGDALVDGRILARAGAKGGSVDVFGQRVGLLKGADIDASGAAGGGQVRIGGDYQGANPDVPNAARTYVDAQARISADATGEGDGGRVIVWADDSTRMHGTISARGGPRGGNGGFSEVSGKQTLDFTGRVDLRAPRGRTGSLLLDPEDITIQQSANGDPLPGESIITTATLQRQLAYSDVFITTHDSGIVNGRQGGHISVEDNVSWTSGTLLSLTAHNGITLNANIDGTSDGTPSGALHLQTRSGDIVQAPTASVRVAKLLVQAAGNVDMKGADNRVKTMAARAAGDFSFTNAQDLVIGEVTLPTGNGYATTRESGLTAANVTVKSGGSIGFNEVVATAASDSGNGGTVTLDATTDIAGQSIAASGARGGGGGTVTVTARGGNIDIGSIAADGANGIEVGATGGAGGSVHVNVAGDLLVSGIQARGGEGGAASGSLQGGIGGAGGTVDITFTGLTGTLDRVSSIDARGGQGGSYYSGIAPSAVGGAGGQGGAITVSGQALSVGGPGLSIETEVPFLLVDLDASGGAPGLSRGTPTTPPAFGANGTISFSAGDLTLGTLFLAGKVRAEATTGTLRTLANSVQFWVSGEAFHLEAQQDVDLRGLLLSAKTAALESQESTVSLDSRSGNIVQVREPEALTSGSFFVSNLIAQADHGRVELKQPNIVFKLAGSAAGTFEFDSTLPANPLVQLEVGTLVSPFASASGISGDAGVTVRALGDLVATQTVSSARGPVKLSAGDADVPRQLPGFLVPGEAGDTPGLPVGGSLKVSAAVTAGTDITLRASLPFGSPGSSAVGLRGANLHADGSVDIGGTVTSSDAFGTAALGIDVVDSTITTTGGSVTLQSPQTVRIASSVIETGGGNLVLHGGNLEHAGHGVLVTEGSSLHADAGTVHIEGSSQATAGFVLESTNGGHTISGADVNIKGTTEAGGTALLIDAETVSSTRSMDLNAVGGALEIRNGSSVSNSGSGPMVLRSSGLASAIVLPADSTLRSTGGGDIDLRADRFVLDGLLDPGTGRTMFRPLDTTRHITINASADDDNLNFSQAFLDGLLGSTIVIGDVGLTGGISIEQATTLRPGKSLSLVTGGAIGQQQGARLTATHLNADGASVVLKEVSIGSGTGGTLSGLGRSGEFIVTNTQAVPAALQIGTVDGRVGITAARPVTLSTPGLLRLSQPVHSDAPGTAITLAAGDLLRDPAGALDAGNGRWLVYLPQPSANLAIGRGPVSGNFALWGRAPGTQPAVTETGNRYLFALTPVLEVAAKGTTKVYDGSSSFGALDFTVTGLVDAAAFGDVFARDALTVSLAVPGATRNVGSYTIERGSLVQPAGYAFSYTPALATITPATLTVAGLTANSKVYDASTFAALSGAASVSPLAGDSVDLAGAGIGTFADKNVGTGKSVAVSGFALAGADAGNYVLRLPTLSANITPASLSLRGIRALDKVYDATTVATLTGAPFVVVSPVLPGDDVSLGTRGIGTFADKNVGSNKSVALSGFTLAGADAGNYVLSLPTLTANITPASLALGGIVASDKVYDATTRATLTGSASLGGVVAGDAVSVVGVDARFGDKNVGNAKPVTVSGGALAGADAGNYRLVLPTGLAANITPATLSLAGLLANDKTYDGATAATLAGTGTLQGVLAGDSVGLVAGSASFADRNAGAGKAVTFAGFGLSGSDAANYRLALPGAQQARITPAPLTIAADSQSKIQGQTLVFNGTEFKAQGLVGAEKVDSVTLASAGAPAPAATGAYPITPSKPVGSNGFASGNYSITFLDGALAVVTVAPQAALAQTSNTLVTFNELFEKEARAQAGLHRFKKDKDGQGGDDIVVTGGSCKP